MTDIMNINVSIAAVPKTGKTHFACTFPDPIKIYSFDIGARFVANKFIKQGKQIDVEEYTMPIAEKAMRDKTDPIIYLPLWDGFYDTFKNDVDKGKYKTLVIDTATAVWSLCGQAETERQDQRKIQRIQYTTPNLLMSSLYQRTALAGINLVTTHYLKDRYIDEKNTGERILAGWNQTEGIVDVALTMRLDRRPGKSRGLFDNVVVTTIQLCRFDNTINGTELERADYNDLIVALGI